MKISLKISDHLNIKIWEDSKSILKLLPLALIKKAILRDTKGKWAKLKLVARKLDVLEYVKLYSSIVNDPDYLRKL